MADSNDAEVQNALNPNPSNLDENDPNVARDPVCGTLVDKRTAPDTMAAPVNDTGWVLSTSTQRIARRSSRPTRRSTAILPCSAGASALVHTDRPLPCPLPDAGRG